MPQTESAPRQSAAIGGSTIAKAAWQPKAASWATQFGVPGVLGQLRAIVAHDDHVYVAGPLAAAGDVLVDRVAQWNRRTGEWWALPEGPGGGGDIAAYESGIYTGGGSTVARWDGSSWTLLGTTDGYVWSVAVDSSGTVYAAGDFTTIDGTAATNIARWDGQAWQPLGSGLHGGSLGTHEVHALVTEGATLYAGGRFGRAGNTEAGNVAAWHEDTGWRALGAGLYGRTGDRIRALAVDAHGDLYAGGSLTGPDGEPGRGIARWDGTAWTAVGVGLTMSVRALAITSDGSVYAGGNVSIEERSLPSYSLVRWDGSTWHPERPWQDEGRMSSYGVGALAAQENEVYAAAIRPVIPGEDYPTNLLRRRTSEGWTMLGGDRYQGVTGTVKAFTTHGDTVYVGGNITYVGSTAVGGIACWTGTEWELLGAGVDGEVRAVAVADDGDVYVGGQFTRAGEVEARNVARWDGAAWHAVAGGVGGELYPAPYVETLALRGDDLYVGGWFNRVGTRTDDVYVIARYNVTTGAWNALGGGLNSQVLDIEFGPDGGLYAGGFFSAEVEGDSLRSVARWDGERWEALGQGLRYGEEPVSMVSTLAFSGETLYAGGVFTHSGDAPMSSIAAWTGAGWQALGGGTQLAVHALQPVEGGLVAGGEFREMIDSSGREQPMRRLAYWDGGRWSAVGGGVSGGAVYTLALSGNDLYAGGRMQYASGPEAGMPVVSLGIARYINAVTALGVTSAREGIPATSVQAAPNPFHDHTEIQFVLERSGRVRVTLYDLLGRHVRTLLDGQRAAGSHRLEIAGGALPAGTYFVRVEPAQGFAQTVRLARVQ